MAFTPHQSSVLLIDCDPSTSQEISLLLAALFETVHTANDFRAAAKPISSQHPNLIVCDLYPTTISREQIAELVVLETPVVFLDRGQHAGVSIKRIVDRGFICLNKTAAFELLPMFCEQAIRHHTSEESESAPAHQPTTIFPGLYTSPDSRTNIHSLY
jgi:DNA-binding NtrC family response regulator